MLDSFHPKEKKALLVFLAVLALLATYLYTHELPWESEVFLQKTPPSPEGLPDNDSSRYY